MPVTLRFTPSRFDSYSVRQVTVDSMSGRPRIWDRRTVLPIGAFGKGRITQKPQ